MKRKAIYCHSSSLIATAHRYTPMAGRDIPSLRKGCPVPVWHTSVVLPHACSPLCVCWSMLCATPAFDLTALSQRQEFQKDLQAGGGREGKKNANHECSCGLHVVKNQLPISNTCFQARVYICEGQMQRGPGISLVHHSQTRYRSQILLGKELLQDLPPGVPCVPGMAHSRSWGSWGFWTGFQVSTLRTSGMVVFFSEVRAVAWARSDDRRELQPNSLLRDFNASNYPVEQSLHTYSYALCPFIICYKYP